MILLSRAGGYLLCQRGSALCTRGVRSDADCLFCLIYPGSRSLRSIIGRGDFADTGISCKRVPCARHGCPPTSRMNLVNSTCLWAPPSRFSPWPTYFWRESFITAALPAQSSQSLSPSLALPSLHFHFS